MAADREVFLTSDQHAELRSMAPSRSLPCGLRLSRHAGSDVGRGGCFNTMKRRLQTTAPTIIRWKQRLLESGIDGLDTDHPGHKATVLTPGWRVQILSATRKKPTDGSTHWSCRKLAAAL